MPPQRSIAPYYPPTNDTRSARASRKFDRDDAEPLGLRRVVTQALHDLYGTKDVQDAITATYVWLADQLGHVTLGFVPTLALCWAWRRAWAWICPSCGSGDVWLPAGYVVAALVVFAYWIHKEVADYHDTWQRRGNVFMFNASDIWWNVETALLYFAIGGLLALASFIHVYLLLGVLVLALWPAARVAFWWVRRKVAFQQAGLPYLYRLANFKGRVEESARDAIGALVNLRNKRVWLLNVCFGRDPIHLTRPATRHLLITGPLGAGKTSLAVGIGTEFAFSLGIGRYLSVVKLLQLAARDGSAGGMEYDDGRVLWPWNGNDLLIVDDVDAGLGATGGAATAPAGEFIRPEDFRAALTRGQPGTPLDWLRDRRSVWVVGDFAEAESWRNVIAGLIGIDAKEMIIVQLEVQPKTAS